jgi:ubiquinone/menaquinone biosynthesis C-methylase UbiE
MTAIEEIHRVLKPDGICFIDMPNRLWPIEPHYRILLFPFLPKWLHKIYLRLRGKNPKELENINFFTAGKLASELKKSGFKNIKNLSRKESLEKINNPESINTPLVKKMGWVGLFVLKLLIRIDFYPTIRMSATK